MDRPSYHHVHHYHYIYTRFQGGPLMNEKRTLRLYLWIEPRLLSNVQRPTSKRGLHSEPLLLLRALFPWLTLMNDCCCLCLMDVDEFHSALWKYVSCLVNRRRLRWLCSMIHSTCGDYVRALKYSTCERLPRVILNPTETWIHVDLRCTCMPFIDIQWDLCSWKAAAR